MVARVRRGGELEGRTRATLRAAAGGGSGEREGCTHDGACPFNGITVVFRGIFSLEKEEKEEILVTLGDESALKQLRKEELLFKVFLSVV